MGDVGAKKTGVGCEVGHCLLVYDVHEGWKEDMFITVASI
jgi:hypothetical protein